MEADSSRTEHGSPVGRLRTAEMPAACARTMRRLAERRVVLASRHLRVLLAGDLTQGEATRGSG